MLANLRGLPVLHQPERAALEAHSKRLPGVAGKLPGGEVVELVKRPA
ncbi:MAG: hypothetical protein MUF66_04010 [Gammaproteobacteria bacterium]|nr:hypothetical protein [Gammaproteobacteria bacterium]